MLRESYPEQMSRLFRPDQIVEHGVNTYHSKTITFQVTEACNLCCTYCYQGAKTHKKMTFETAKIIVDMLLASDSRTNRYVTMDKLAGVVFDFIGGEPFLEVNLIDKIMDYFVEKAFLLEHPLAYRYMISISSNGTLYFTPNVQRFIEKWHRHLSLSISVDGNQQLHDTCRVFPDGSGSYGLAIAAAKDYMEKYGELGSKMTISPGNVMYVAEAVKDLHRNGYKTIMLNCVYEKGWELEHARILYQQLKELADYFADDKDAPYMSIFDEYIGHPLPHTENQNWCGGTGSMLAFDPDGRAYPCVRYMESSLSGEQPPYEIGDISNGLMNTEKHRNRVEQLERITRRSQSTDECWDCPIASGCSWCSAYNYQCNGTPDKRVTYICPMHKARTLANCYFWNTRYRAMGETKRYAISVPHDWAVPIVGEEEFEMLKKLAEVR